MDEFPGNSQTDKAAKPAAAKKTAETKPVKREKIVQGEVIQRKPPRMKRFLSDARGVFSFVRSDVLVPAAKDMIADAGREALERAIFGESRPRGPRGSYGRSPIGHTRYDGAFRPAGPSGWRNANTQPVREVSSRGRSQHDFGEIVLESRGEAEQVIDTLFQIIEQYQQASVSDLYELVGITPQYTDQKYGWTDLQGSRAVHVRGGSYLLQLPRPIPLD